MSQASSKFMMTHSADAVAINELSHTYSGARGVLVSALRDLNASFAPGEFVSVLGPSGCGKSTLLKIIAGLQRPSQGRVSAPGRKSYVFQEAHLLPWRDVLSNVALPLELRGLARSEREARAREALTPLGLLESAGRFPGELSGGMKMRASLARALVTQPDLLLLDEPFAALDEVIRFRLAERLRSLWWERKKSPQPLSVVFVTHSISEAVYLSDRVLVMSARPGTIVADVPLELPQERSIELRTEPRFAEKVRALYSLFQAHAEPTAAAVTGAGGGTV